MTDELNDILAEDLARAQRELEPDLGRGGGPATSAALPSGLSRGEQPEPEPAPAPPPDGLYWLKVRVNEHKQTKTRFAMCDGAHHTQRLAVVGLGYERVLVRSSLGAAWLPLEPDVHTQHLDVSLPMRPGWNEVVAYLRDDEGNAFFERMPMARVPRPGEKPTLDFVAKPFFVNDMIRLDGLVLGEDVRRIEARLVGTDRNKVFDIQGGGVHTFMVGIRVPTGRSEIAFVVSTESGQLERSFFVERFEDEPVYARYGLRALLLDPAGTGALEPVARYLAGLAKDLVRPVRVEKLTGADATRDAAVAAWASLVGGSADNSYDRMMCFVAAELSGGPALTTARAPLADGELDMAVLLDAVHAARRSRHTLVFAERAGEALTLDGVTRTATLLTPPGEMSRLAAAIGRQDAWTSLAELSRDAGGTLVTRDLREIDVKLPPAGARS